MPAAADRLSRRLTFDAAAIETHYALLAEIDAVKLAMGLAPRLAPRIAARLTHSMIVTSTGASNRIEGNRLTDRDVELLYRNDTGRKLRTRDEQEVVGYFETLELVLKSHRDMAVNESLILQLHRDMLRYSEKDQRQRGVYKFAPNRVEARDATGRIVGIVFDPTPPHLSPKEMRELVEWLNWADGKNFKHPLIRIANFVFEFLAIHPFQDGNGRVSRLLTNLLLLRNGYAFAALSSHESAIERQKADYYLALRQTQTTWKSKRENIAPWVDFFLRIVRTQAVDALRLFRSDHGADLLSQKQSDLWQWISNRNVTEFSRKEAIAALRFSPRTVEAAVKKLLDLGWLKRIGEGRATRYRRLDRSE